MSWDSGPGTGSGSEWDDPNSPSAPSTSTLSVTEPSSPPLHWLALGLAAAGVGVALPLLTDAISASVLGWFLGGVVALVLWGIFIVRDGTRRARGPAMVSSLGTWLGFALILLAAVAVVANAWSIADELARRQW